MPITNQNYNIHLSTVLLFWDICLNNQLFIFLLRSCYGVTKGGVVELGELCKLWRFPFCKILCAKFHICPWYLFKVWFRNLPNTLFGELVHSEHNRCHFSQQIPEVISVHSTRKLSCPAVVRVEEGRYENCGITYCNRRRKSNAKKCRVYCLSS